MVRLSDRGAAALEALLDGRDDPAAEVLMERLRDAGLIHPGAAPAPLPELTIVVPVLDGGPGLGHLVAALRAEGEVIVVDDGSRDGSVALAREAGARVVPNRGLPGPAGARNTGLGLAATEYVAFIDADCRARAGWLARLAGSLAHDSGLAIAAPRVRGVPGAGRIARYETGASPLDMGPDPSLVGPGRRVGFVPSAALLTRRDALNEVGGFDEYRRVGEDVDLVLRLLGRGWRVRYAPQVEVGHRSRETVSGLMRQRFAYAGSAAGLDRAHPGSVAPLRSNPRTLATVIGFALDPRLGASSLAAGVLAAARNGHDAESRLALARLTLRANFGAARHLSRAMTRDWMPLTAVSAILSRRGRRWALAAIAVDLACASRRDAQAQGLLPRTLLRAADNASYAAGLWLGMTRERSFRALLPSVAGGGKTRDRQAPLRGGVPRTSQTRAVSTLRSIMATFPSFTLTK
jgi:mycofactocin system glycosyltransferase